MYVAGDTQLRALAARLRGQVTALVAVLAMGRDDADQARMLAAVAESAGAARPWLCRIDPLITEAVDNACGHARRGEHDLARSELLLASRRLLVVLRAGYTDGTT
jgi:hypothetical protein